MYKVFTGMTVGLEDSFILWGWKNRHGAISYIGLTQDIVPVMTRHPNFKQQEFESLEDALELIKQFYDCNLSPEYRSIYYGGGFYTRLKVQELKDFKKWLDDTIARDDNLVSIDSEYTYDNASEYSDDDYDDDDDNSDDDNDYDDYDD